MTFSSTTKLLIPAAGFGKRLQADRSKELLILKEENEPMIEWSLKLAQAHDMQAVIISREDKNDLNEFLEKKKATYDLEVMLIRSSIEWADSLLQAEELWSNSNIVLLPDTRFKPMSIIADLNNVLLQSPCAFATFRAESLKTWGAIRYKDEKYFIAEKPESTLSTDLAWGLFGFNESYGKALLQTILKSTSDFILLPEGDVETLPLEYFEDKTRNGLGGFKL